MQTQDTLSYCKLHVLKMHRSQGTQPLLDTEFYVAIPQCIS